MTEMDGSIWKSLRLRPHLASHVRKVRINCYITKYMKHTLYAERLTRFFLHADHLSHVELEVDRPGSQEILFIILSCLAKLKNKPKVSFLRMPGNEGENALGIRELIIRFKDKLQIIKLETDSAPADLQYAAKFHQLERLNVHSSTGEKSFDLCQYVNLLPLVKMAVCVQANDMMRTFPERLRILRLYLFYSTLFHETWRAICSLKSLDELIIGAKDVEGGPLLQFESSDLRKIHIYVDSNSDETVTCRIFSPIFQNCRHLRTAVLGMNPLSSILSSIQIPSSTLSSLHVKDHLCSYTFQNLVDNAGKLPMIRDTILPWPICDQDYQAPERLTFQLALRLSNAWCRSDEIEFRLKQSEQTQYWKWSEFDSLPLRIPSDMPLDHCNRNLPYHRGSHLAQLQSFKMARLIEESSPCLNICTVFFHYYDKNYPDTKGKWGQDIVVFLSLKNVRRHRGHL